MRAQARIGRFTVMYTLEPWRWTVGLRFTSRGRDIHLVLPVITLTLWLPAALEPFGQKGPR